jgi:hypothetical protein
MSQITVMCLIILVIILLLSLYEGISNEKTDNIGQ